MNQPPEVHGPSIAMTITYSDFIQTITENEGEVLVTVGGDATFRAEKRPHGVHFVPVSTGKPLNQPEAGIQRSLELFNETKSLTTTDYKDIVRTSSYLLAIIKLLLGQHPDASLMNDGTTESGEIDPEFSASEGNIKVRSHRQRERSRELVTMAKKAFRIKHQRLFCEVCGFDFGETYGEPDFIEAHHRIPLCDLQPGMKTKLSDLAMVCSNCHRMLHRGNPWPTVAELREKISRK